MTVISLVLILDEVPDTIRATSIYVYGDNGVPGCCPWVPASFFTKLRYQYFPVYLLVIEYVYDVDDLHGVNTLVVKSVVH